MLKTLGIRGSRIPEWSFSAVQAGFWMSFCVSVSFAAVYLQALGYTNGTLGLILALGNLLGVLVSLGLSTWIDREETITAGKLLPKAFVLQTAAVLALLAYPVKGLVTSLAF
jgi:PPP family 3-phenylpropionic acid transporter